MLYCTISFFSSNFLPTAISSFYYPVLALNGICIANSVCCFNVFSFL